MLNLFAYGTLLCEEIFTAIAGGTHCTVSASLPGFKRYRIKNELYPGIIRYTGSCVDGLLYRDITAAQWERLDQFEGEMYTRESVVVTTAHGETSSAQTYVIKDAYKQCIECLPWSVEAFTKRETSL